ncbi:TolC family outer membrane protein [uncultured Vibrio sp.]|uniref:TolC family outer membrane protein n=1 Tax=uncultured Vibrio sp. TaxID=114054 RepID=UPI0025F88F10|nr:TolC family outer membrane protein [uncultured Vibrio sp.]
MALTLSTPAIAQVTDLEGLYSLAQKNDPLLSQAKLQAEMAGDAVSATSASLLPQINSYFGYQYLNDNRGVEANYGGDGQAVVVGAQLSQMLYSPAVKLAVEVANQDATIADLLVDKASDALVLRTATAYFNVLRAREMVGVANANLETIGEFRDQTATRVRLGLTADLDLQEAQARYDRAAANIINAEALLSQRLDALTTLTGETFSDVDPLDVNRFSPAIPTPSYGRSWHEMAMANNYDLRLTTFSIDKARTQVRQAKAGHKPSVIFSAGVNQELLMDVFSLNSNPGGDGFKMDNLTEVEVGVTAHLPLYSGGRTSAMVRIAQSGLETAQSVNDQTARSITELVNTTERFSVASLKSLKAHEQSLVSAKSALIAVEKGYEVGSRTMAEVLAANTAVFAAENAVNNARFDFIERTLTLKFIAGELSGDDISALNAGLVRN